MKPTVLVPAGFTKRLLGRLSETYNLMGPLRPEGPNAQEREARVLITLGSLTTSAALMDSLPNLGLISCFGTGFEGVDLAAARARNIVVSHAGDTNSTAVAEFAMGLVIATARDLVRGDRYARANRWRGDIIERLPIVPGLAGQRLGIYGLGSIGSKLAQRAAAFEMEIGYHNRKPRPGVPYAYHPTLLELATWADILVVAVRADKSNTHAINREVLAALGPRGHLVNISRGIAVDTEALCDALEAGTISGAALDVYENEPSIPDRLKVLDNVVITPHMAAISANAQRAQRDIMFANLEAFFAGRPVLTPVPE
ncbi:MAG: 2-hydroxyacid dehydrogenase [Hyphomicrobiaceae bacterium]|jgi:lactate dehydrogenase-like 2-hydroxyacid dehydrogenase